MQVKRLGRMVLLLLCSAGAWSKVHAQTETPGASPAVPRHYSATAFGQAGSAAGKSVGVDLYITQWTSDEDLQAFVTTLANNGPDGLLNALQKTKDVGRLSPTGSVGSGIRIARYSPTPEGGLRIMTVTDRPITFSEAYHGTRSRYYPFGIVDLVIDPAGKATGTLAPACKIRFNKQKQLEIEHYGIKPLRLVNVRLTK